LLRTIKQTSRRLKLLEINAVLGLTEVTDLLQTAECKNVCGGAVVMALLLLLERRNNYTRLFTLLRIRLSVNVDPADTY